ncbi:MAG: hypothetical protein ACYDHD_04730 [Vulcanimicrobiaceae bacterium]
MKHTLALAIAAVAVLAATACSSTGTSPNPLPTATPLPQYVYVANYNNMAGSKTGNLVVFSLPLSSGESPSVTLPAPQSGAGAMGIAQNAGQLAVKWGGAQVISVYAKPITDTSAPLLSFSASDPANGGAPLNLFSLAYDSSGNLYGGTQFGQIVEYTAPLSSSSTPAIHVSLPNSGSYPVVAVNGTTLAVGTFSPAAIYIYSLPLSNTSTPMATIAPASAAYADVAFDSLGNLYAVNWHTGIEVYKPPFGNSSTPAFTIPEAMSGAPGALALDSANDLFEEVGNAAASMELGEYPATVSASSVVTNSTTSGLDAPWTEITIGN